MPTHTHPIQDEVPSILSEDASMPIAIVGMGFRGPADATNVERLWKLIVEGREGWSRIPARRWNPDAFYHPDNTRHGTINVQGGHFLTEDVSLFDAPFFNMTSDEAAAMDPQQRLLLEVTYEGLENAGIPLPSIMGSKTACFVGSFSADYTDMLLRDPDSVPMYQCTNAGQSRAMTANRVSYFFDLKGPSVTVDTACSGSLIALHLACQSLRTGDASTAIAAGVNVVLSHEFMSTMSMMKFLSPDGRCHTFDEDANGYARGEAIGCLILKPLQSALREGDTIRAIIRGSGSNQDGRTPGITLPSSASQEALIRDVYSTAGLDPLETEFVEAHGTGTQAGDPIETGALAKVFSPGRAVDRPLRVGSIKTNVGHLEGTSGVAGVIKAVLMLENRVFLPNRNFKTLNPRILLDEWKLKLQLDTEAWESPGPHRVSVNSFGYGGSNAHIVLEDTAGYLANRGLKGLYRIKTSAIQATNGNGEINGNGHTQQTHRTRVYTLSGFDENSCIKQAEALREYLLGKDSADDEFLNNLAYTLNQLRTKLSWKTGVIGSSAASLAEALSGNMKLKRTAKKPSLGFVFTGQGAQWCGMGRELFHAYPAFRQSIERIDAHLAQIGAPYCLVDEILENQDATRLSHPLHSQPICSALQIALVDLLATWDIYAESVTGHSSGEIAAAYAVGVLSMEDAMTVAYYRGVTASRLPIDRQTKGGMMALGMSAEDVQPYVDRLTSGKVVVACINSPSTVTISGDLPAIEELESVLSDKQVFSRRLAVDVAYHSHHMKQIGDEYLAFISNIKPREMAKASFFSSVTGTEVYASDLGPQYWVSNLLGQVKFVDAIRTLCFETNQKNAGAAAKRFKRAGTAKKVSVDCLVEVGPHSALSGSIKQILKADGKLDAADIAYTSPLIRKMNAVNTALTMAAALATAGYPINFQALNNPEKHETQLIVDLPPYAWNHSRSYWAEPRLSKTYRNRKFPRSDLLGVSDNMACPFEPRWRNIIRVSEIPWLKDHKIQSNIVYPAAGYIAMAIEAVSQLAQDEVFGYRLRDVSIQSALVIHETSAAEVMTSLRKTESIHSDSDKVYSFHVYSVTDDNRWTEHCKGNIQVQTSNPESDTIQQPIDKSTLSTLDIQPFYEKLSTAGLEYGPCFANMTAAHFTKDVCVAEITIPDTAAVMPMHFQHPFVIHPCTLDSFFHSIFASLSAGMKMAEEPVIPVFIDDIYVSRGVDTVPGGKMSIHARVRKGGGGDVLAAIEVGDRHHADGAAVSITGLRCRRIASGASTRSAKQVDRLAYRFKWDVDPDLLSSEDIAKLLAADEVHTEDLDKDSALFYIKKAVDAVSESEVSPQAHLKKLWHSLVEIAGKYPTISKLDTEPHELLCAIGEQLPAILKGEVDVSSILDDNILSTYWNTPRVIQSYEQASVYLNVLGHKNPKMSILEIGSGAAASSIFLDKLTGEDDIPRCGQYALTDDSENSTQQLTRWSQWVNYKKLDINEDLKAQGFTDKQYDVVIVSNGLYTAKSRDQAVKSIRSILRDDGHLMFINPVHHENLSDCIIFGSLSRIDHAWDDALRAQFSVTPCHDVSLTISRPLKETPPPPLDILIITEEENDISTTLTSLLQSSNVETTDLAHAIPAGRLCIILSDLKTPLLASPSEETLSILKQIFLYSTGVLWVTRGGTISPTNPDAGLAVGFARTARSESGADPIVTLDLDGRNILDGCRAAGVISDLFRYLFVGRLSGADTEYAERDGRILIPRIVEDAALNESIASAGLDVLHDEPFHQDRPLRAVVDDNEDIHFDDDHRPTDLPDDHVGIHVHAIGLTKQDARIASEMSPESLLGCQCSGTVYTVGKDVEGFTPGDRVACLGSGTAANIYHGRASAFQKLPDNLSYEVGATVPVAYCAAYYMLHRLARISTGEAVLIHDAADPCGLASVEMCHAVGCDVLAIVASESQKMMLSSLNIPENQIFIGAESSIKEIIRTSRVDVVIDCHDPDNRRLHSLWKCISPYGRFIQVGTQAIQTSRLSLPRFTKDITFTTFDFANLQKEQPDILANIWSKVMILFSQGILYGPPSQSTYPISSINEAIKAVNQDQTSLVVVTTTSNDLVKTTPPKTTSTLLHPDASYMLIGGLGGIGLATALWMAEHGAKSIIFVSRSGTSRPGSQATVDELEEKGVRVIVQSCDVANSKDVQTTMADLAETAPPIRGVIQAAMVLRDIHIEKMTATDYTTVLSPKHAGTWNLHHHLPADLDFFLLLSSISGVIGNATQSAYAAGSAFMDAFAAYRNTLGLPGIALDLGVITDVGYLAENKELAAKMAQQGFVGMDTGTLMGLVEKAIMQSQSTEDVKMKTAQIVTGLGEWKEGQSLSNFDAPLFAQFRRRYLHLSGGNAEESADTLHEDLKAVKNLDDAAGLVYVALSAKIASHLSVPVDSINPSSAISEYGIDSHVAVEMRNWIAKNMESTVPILEILASGSVMELAMKIAAKSVLVRVE
ncbi:hypothetical protein MW887_003422 [Aspergillus wentii]|nr:hypothetical protein MW887_003422 [Aspergillus wentii]